VYEDVTIREYFPKPKAVRKKKLLGAQTLLFKDPFRAAQ
jgi:hypothetical protein